MSGPKGPRLLSSLFRRLLPGRMGAEACEELERQHAQRRDRHGRVLAWLWYAAHFGRPDTWKLAVALRRQRKSAGSRSRRSAFISILDVKLGVRMLFKHPGLTLVSGFAMAVGRHLRILGPGEAEHGPRIEIVGVVEDLTENPMNPNHTRSRVFTPLPPPESLSSANLILRMRSSPADFGPRLRQITTAVDPTLRVDFVAPLEEFDDPMRSVLRVAVLGIALAVLSVLLLATAGVYALMSFNVTQRRREIGIRSALGAHPRRVLAGIFSRAALQLGSGGLVGIAGAVLLERTVVQGMVPGPRPGSGLMLLVALLMVGVGLLAAVGPARRGLRIEPSEALREG